MTASFFELPTRPPRPILLRFDPCLNLLKSSFARVLNSDEIFCSSLVANLIIVLSPPAFLLFTVLLGGEGKHLALPSSAQHCSYLRYLTDSILSAESEDSPFCFPPLRLFTVHLRPSHSIHPHIRATPPRGCDSEPQLQLRSPLPDPLSVALDPSLLCRGPPALLRMDIPNIVFEGIREWASSDSPPGPRNVSFAHLKVSRHCMSDENVWQVIMAGLWDADRGICVGSSLDAAAAYYAHHRLWAGVETDEGPGFEFQCYHGWRESLTSYRVANGPGLKSWNMDIAPTDSLCVAFVIDSQMSAECAISLIATVQWAADVSSQYMIRVMTISSEDAPRALRKLLYIYDLGCPHPLSLNPPDSIALVRREVQTVIRTDQSDIV